MLQPNFYPRATEWMKRKGYSAFDMVGFTPEFLSTDDPDDAVTQLDKHYGHGGGWHDFSGFTFNDGAEPTLTYPGDPPTLAVAWWKLRDERVILFDSAWVAVVQPDGSFRISRMD